MRPPDKCNGVTRPSFPPPGANPNGYYSCFEDGWRWIENIGLEETKEEQ